MVAHPFGGAWTEVKLDAIASYLAYYNNVLRTQPRADRPFRRWYIDAFAGSGSRTAEIARGGLLDGEPISIEQIELEGSARKALAIDPPFDRLLFIEPHRGRFKGLSGLKEEYPSRSIDCRRGDANQELASIFSGGAVAYSPRAKLDRSGSRIFRPVRDGGGLVDAGAVSTYTCC